jgi:hypothetical protein
LRFSIRSHVPNYHRLGLVVVEASYGPSEQDIETKHLAIDVTIAVQALVRGSQLYIAGHRTKVSLFMIVALWSVDA